MMFSINLVTCKELPSALKCHIYACLQAPPRLKKSVRATIFRLEIIRKRDIHAREVSDNGGESIICREKGE